MEYHIMKKPQKLQAVLNRAVRWGFYKATDPNLEQICSKREDHLFFQIISNPNHVLHQYLPPRKSQPYNLRPKGHDRVLPMKPTSLIANNFMERLLYKTL